VTQQTMDFLSDSWANMAQKADNIDLTGNWWSQERRRVWSNNTKQTKGSR